MQDLCEAKELIGVKSINLLENHSINNPGHKPDHSQVDYTTVKRSSGGCTA